MYASRNLLIYVQILAKYKQMTSQSNLSFVGVASDAFEPKSHV